MKEILDSWEENAQRWVELLAQQGIVSRKITNPAIVETLRDYAPHTVCDLGCGEGWLTRTLHAHGMQVTGVDGTAALVAQAQAVGTQPYFTLRYEELIAGAALPNAPFDAILFNFSLYLHEETVQMLEKMQYFLTPQGHIFIQTLHPAALLDGQMHYRDQWLLNAWNGLPSAFTSPHRWYFRTLSGWVQALTAAQLQLVEVREPLHEDQTRPASIILIAKPVGR